ncbi:sensor histidine kinase [Marinilabiliaceae bacterium JC017]|nr:sensor histidine kinase [Marinilabiliaceae bacterium JC017]
MQLLASQNGLVAKVINNRLFQHLTYWVLFVIFFAFAWGSYDSDYTKTVLVELINLPSKILLVYGVIYFLYPAYLYKGKIWEFIFLFLSFLFLASVIQRIIDNQIILDNFFPHWHKESTFNLSQLVRSAVNLGAVLAIPMTVKLTEYLSKVQQREQMLAKDKLEAELVFLKNQVQPHFLFNTLNSLYSLILKKSDKSLEVVLKLSDLLRYMLYETNAPQVDLYKEVESIKSYLELERIRYGNRVELSFNTWGELAGKTIAPMIILPFIENSFKHSTKGFDGKSWITIELGVKENELVLKIENSVPEVLPQESRTAGGIGLQNVQRRLALLYPQEYDLKIASTADSYLIILKLTLKNRV